MFKGLTYGMMVTVAAAAILAGCGTSGSLSQGPIAAPMASSVDAMATKTLLQGFRQIHQVVFRKLDANHDGLIDEYEAGPAIDLNDFTKADKNHNGKLTLKEFMDFATEGSLFGFCHEDKVQFMKQTRSALGAAFNRIDTDHDRLLSSSELSGKGFVNLKLNLTIPGLHTKVTITEVDPDVFTASDHTGDGKLSQAEFEDFCLDSFLKLIDPTFVPGPAPAPTSDPSADPSTDPSAAPATGSW